MNKRLHTASYKPLAPLMPQSIVVQF